MSLESPIDSFTDEFRFLSNFWPVTIEHEGFTFPSVENAYQVSKTLDLNKWQEFQTLTAGKAKREGRKLVIRPDWKDIKVPTMVKLVYQKFDDPVLSKMLVDTGTRQIIEGNTWNDTFWGICDGKGKNMLGKILMRKRQWLSHSHCEIFDFGD